MFQLREALSPSTRAFLDRERVVTPVPTTRRARALGRARAAVAQRPETRPLTRGSLTIRWAAGLLCLATVAGGAAAYEIAVRAQLATPPGAAPPPTAHEQSVFGPGTDSPVELRDVPAPVRSSARSAPAREEMRLLERARAAAAREDYAAAIAPLDEHARRFPEGWLAEEREALRVEALAGLGRTSEARRAASTFEARFPRSPLLPAVSQISEPTQ
jgi:hypothetical protein